ncbi:MAG TPA: DUF1987 domain-containing protein [Acidobacteriota bacterium]|nr:DUF1987 domain-containing protein [Acidobacteriota bacterium]HNC43391.1 DUF1987 domain-containing protein [Acidobacteriota bacterium]HND19567.1 DUF1987 domain-containing protein [Acidobacteriota bacterium]HNG93107.1 DUF1987 domain-containing protein [Acidobacteriota bacterium]HNH83428.1 DUF1987 domain-containing protein [Acidobacteriota bacterium]
MENLIVDKTKVTPQVSFDAATGIMEIAGESYPENSMQFYQPVFKWLQEFFSSEPGSATFNFKLEYFNTSSSKCILNILEILEDAHSEGHTIELNWYYREDDDDMLESGQEFCEDMTLPFKFISY